MTLFNPNPKRNTATTTALAPATTIAVPTHHPPLTTLTTHYLPTSQWRQDKYIVIVANPNPNTATSSPTTVPLPLPPRYHPPPTPYPIGGDHTYRDGP